MRRLSNVIFAVTLIAWVLAIGVYVRSKFRADVITIVTRGHCVVVAENNGAVTMADAFPWPGPGRFQWSSDKISDEPFFFDHPHDKLRGPLLDVDSFSTSYHERSWRDFKFESGPLDNFEASSAPSIHESWRSLRAYSGMALPSGIHVRNLSVPTWFVAVLFGIIPAPWLIMFNRRRLRRRSRLRRGLCIQCGYDLRQSPARCPECGSVRT